MVEGDVLNLVFLSYDTAPTCSVFISPPGNIGARKTDVKKKKKSTGLLQYL